MDEFNRTLQRWLVPSRDPKGVGNKGDESSIERVETVQNVRWQTRADPPTAYENALAEALQTIFADEVYDLPGIVRRLNDAQVAPPGGQAWTEENFAAEMARLGA
jgi:hypothetical protein